MLQSDCVNKTSNLSINSQHTQTHTHTQEVVGVSWACCVRFVFLTDEEAQTSTRWQFKRIHLQWTLFKGTPYFPILWAMTTSSLRVSFLLIVSRCLPCWEKVWSAVYCCSSAIVTLIINERFCIAISLWCSFLT